MLTAARLIRADLAVRCGFERPRARIADAASSIVLATLYRHLGTPLLVHTIVLATRKGGSGKTTLAIGLALAARQAGHTVRLIDTDSQGTLSNWQVRRRVAEPIVEKVRGAGNLEHRLDAAARGGVSLAIIDTASGLGDVTIAAIRACDLCLIPVRPTVADIDAMTATFGIVRRWRKPFAFILNQTPVRGRRTGDAADTLGGLSADMNRVLAQPFVAMRSDHQDALAAGLSVIEYAPWEKSADDIRRLWQWTQARLNDRPEPGIEDATFAIGAARARSGVVNDAATSWRETRGLWDACL